MDAMDQEHERIARELYEAFCASLGGVTPSGAPLAKWEAIRNDMKHMRTVLAWLAVAHKAIELKKI